MNRSQSIKFMRLIATLAVPFVLQACAARHSPLDLGGNRSSAFAYGTSYPESIPLWGQVGESIGIPAQIPVGTTNHTAAAWGSHLFPSTPP